PAGTPCLLNPPVRVAGNVLASPVINSEKDSPTDNDVPEFWNVCRMPDATPRWLAGTLLIIADVFGAENIPEPMPLSATTSSTATYGQAPGSESRPTKLAPYSNRPVVASERGPNRSDR